MYAAGMAVSGLGVLGIVVCFIGFGTAGMDQVDSFGKSSNDPFDWFIGFFVSMLLIAGGQAIRSVAARGVAGSGLVLDPERARDDLEPWARVGGGLVGDALDEAGLQGRREDDPSSGSATEPQEIYVRCRSCKGLNDESARFCDQCGAEL